METILLITNNSTQQIMKYNVNRIKTPTIMTKIKFNHKMNQQQKHQQHRKENINLCHTMRCHLYKHRITTTTTTRKLSRTTLKQKSLNLVKIHLWFIILLTTLIHHVESIETTTNSSTTLEKSTTRYSKLLSTNAQMTFNNDNAEENVDDDDTFRPFVPKDLELVSRNVFTASGNFRVFQPTDTDLRATVTMARPSYKVNKMSEPLSASTSLSPFQTHMENQPTSTKQHTLNINTTSDSNLSKQRLNNANRRHDIDMNEQRNEITKQNDDLASDLKSLEELLVEYATNFFEQGQYEPMPGLVVELQNNHSDPLAITRQDKIRKIRHVVPTDAKVSVDLPRTLATGRLLFLTGLKKVLWPVFMGLQVLKSLLIAMFIPAIIGSFTKLIGKGITTGSAPLFIRPMEPPQELDFRDNSINFDDDNKFLVPEEGNKDNGPYAYNQPDASQMHNQYVYNQAASNPLTFTRLGMNERQHQLMQDSYMSALQSIGSASFKNSGSLSSGSSGLLAPMANKPPPVANANTFQQFQKVPDSSLLLSNYDPFYSPLLSRLDSVFAQLKINSDNEVCREKLICLMYANPAKYAPYSNLVSAQLSRELNELRKPTSDNPDILRFFKYMRAAKDGQDGVDCEQTFEKCTEFKDFENPVMVSTYHDINKLVQARKLT